MADEAPSAAEQTLAGLGWNLDRRDWEAARTHLADTVHTDYTRVFGGDPQNQSGDDRMSQWRALLGSLATTQHLITNVRTSNADGDTAQATANVVGTHVSRDGRTWTVGGWWDTELRRDGDRYLITSITLHPSWQTGDIAVMTAE